MPRMPRKEFNVYGVGNYFAADLRLSLWFIRGQPDFPKKIILCQVACGRIGERERLFPNRVSRQQWLDALRRPQNKLPPKGCQSATSRQRKELVVYKHNHAYPAYKITLRHAHRPRNPYASPALLKELRGLEEVPYPQLSRSPQPSKKPSGLTGAAEGSELGLHVDGSQDPQFKRSPQPSPSAASLAEPKAANSGDMSNGSQDPQLRRSPQPSPKPSGCSAASLAQPKAANSGYLPNGSQESQLRRSPQPSPRPSGCLASSSAPSLALPKAANSGYMSNGSQDPQLRRSPQPSAKPSRLLASSSATSITLPKAANSGYMSKGEGRHILSEPFFLPSSFFLVPSSFFLFPRHMPMSERRVLCWAPAANVRAQ
eukprot:Skav200127  [mRNA]  locus=scaffold3069:139020:140877:+ [translate_table: standard]